MKLKLDVVDLCNSNKLIFTSDPITVGGGP
jgi:hypothetical protein